MFHHDLNSRPQHGFRVKRSHQGLHVDVIGESALVHMSSVEGRSYRNYNLGKNSNTTLFRDSGAQRNPGQIVKISEGAAIVAFLWGLKKCIFVGRLRLWWLSAISNERSGPKCHLALRRWTSALTFFGCIKTLCSSRRTYRNAPRSKDPGSLPADTPALLLGLLCALLGTKGLGLPTN